MFLCIANLKTIGFQKDLHEQIPEKLPELLQRLQDLQALLPDLDNLLWKDETPPPDMEADPILIQLANLNHMCVKLNPIRATIDHFRCVYGSLRWSHVFFTFDRLEGILWAALTLLQKRKPHKALQEM